MVVKNRFLFRVSLVVTEIFDCALLGEGVIATLKHAWDKLLSSNKLSEVSSVLIFFFCVTMMNNKQFKFH